MAHNYQKFMSTDNNLKIKEAIKMTKKRLPILILVLTLVFALGTTAALTAYADMDEDRVFFPKYDTMFEDFDREDVSDTVSYTGDVEVGEKAYLRVVFQDGSTDSQGDAIYKQGHDNGGANRGNLVIIMRSPDLSASISDMLLTTRFDDTPGNLYEKAFTAMFDGDAMALPELTDEYQKYIINFANSYENDEKYGNAISVNGGVMNGIHIHNLTGATGTIDIREIYFTTDSTDTAPASRTILNSFIGGATVDKTHGPNTWWSGSGTGVIVKRTVEISTGGILEIVNPSKASAGYDYAIVNASGDTDDLMVSFYNGSSFIGGTAFSKVLTLPEEVTGFKFELTDGTVVIENIFYTNFEEDVIATGFPIFDPSTTQKFEHFNVSQSGFTGDYDAMSTRPELAPSEVVYRLSYNNGDKVTIADGALIFDATALGSDFINFKTESINPNTDHNLLIMKMKGESGANLQGFRISTGGAAVWGNGGLKSGVGLPIIDLDATDYPYTTVDGWMYIIVDIAESGLNVPVDGIASLDFYYSGAGKLYIDEIFWASEYVNNGYSYNTLAYDENVTFTPAGAGYAYAGYAYAPNLLKQPYMAITMNGTEGASLDTVRFEFKDSDDATLGFFWFSENAQGTLLDPSGNVLPALSTDSQTYIIDLKKSGVEGTIQAFHIHSGGDDVGGSFTIETIEYLFLEIIEETIVSDTTLSFTPDSPDYQYLTYVSAQNVNKLEFLALVISGSADASLDSIRLGFMNTEDESLGTYWFADNEFSLLGVDGTLLPALSTESRIFIIDLKASGIEGDIGAFHIHSGGIDVGGTINFELIKFVSFAPLATTVMANLEVYAIPDVISPEIALDLATTATAGDTITINPVVTDNISAEADIIVEILVQLGSVEVTLTDNSFVAEVGTYTITITATDEAGNETTIVRQVTVSASDEPDPGEDPGEDPDEDEDDDEGLSLGVKIGIIAGTLAIIIIVVIVVIIKKKKN